LPAAWFYRLLSLIGLRPLAFVLLLRKPKACAAKTKQSVAFFAPHASCLPCEASNELLRKASKKSEARHI
jgi:hypothetical protein